MMKLKFTFIFTLGVLVPSVAVPTGVLWAAPAAVEADIVTGNVRGVVVDGTGGSLPGATVRVRVGKFERKVQSDARGSFRVEGVPAGPTSVSVSLDRFQPETIDVAASRPALRVVLVPSGVSERVEVSAGAVAFRTITATKTDTPLRDVPQSITVIGKGQLEEQSIRSVQDLVRYVPGIGIAQGEGNRDTPVFRGSSSTADFTVDGIRDDVQYFRDFYNVSRVEALKGPDGMIFGRAGVGGVINRVTKQADWTNAREVAIQGGSFTNRRLQTDVGQALNDRAALRVLGMYENSDSYRSRVGVERYGFNPSMAFRLSSSATLTMAYERFHDDRVADRGVPSFNGRPLQTDPSTFFGNPDVSLANATVDAGTALLAADLGRGVTVRNRTRVAAYDKFYQNVFPGAVNDAGTTVSLSAYNNRNDRNNFFNQTDFNWRAKTGGWGHTLLAGVELGRQVSDNLRTTGFFSNISPTTTTVNVPIDDPLTSLPMTWAPNATDADNHGVAKTLGLYVQDQILLSRNLQAIVGVRYDNFDADVTNNRTAQHVSAKENLVSPRAGLILKPTERMSVYASYTVAYQPRAGEQLTSLSLTNRALDPEKFQNREFGVKWDLAESLSFTAALYRLTRNNVAVTDPADSTRLILVDGQRVNGVELGIGGSPARNWTINGGYAYQDGKIVTSPSATVPAGARLASVPRHSFSLWNRVDFASKWGAGVGLIRQTDMFASTDNLVVLPGYTRVDAAVFYRFNKTVRGQVNVENLFDERYFVSAHSNNNITPGSPRAIRAALTLGF